MTARSYTRSWARVASNTCSVGSMIAPSTGCPSIAARTRAGNWLRKPLGRTRPNVLRMPRTQFFSVVICDTIWARATSSARTAWQSRPFTITSRYAHAHDLRQTEGVVGVGLVDLQRQRRLGVARIDADHGEAGRFQPVEQPVRQLPAFHPDPNRMGRVLFHG